MIVLRWDVWRDALTLRLANHLVLTAVFVVFVVVAAAAAARDDAVHWCRDEHDYVHRCLERRRHVHVGSDQQLMARSHLSQSIFRLAHCSMPPRCTQSGPGLGTGRLMDNCPGLYTSSTHMDCLLELYWTGLLCSTVFIFSYFFYLSTPST